MGAAGGIYKQLVREWRILALLEGSGRSWDREQLAAHFDVSPKTVGRDMEHLEQAGFGIQRQIRGKRESFRLAQARRSVPPVVLSLPELAALQLARSKLIELAPEPYYPALSGAFEKVGLMLSPETQRYCGRIERLAVMHSRGVKVPRVKPELIERLTRAIVERHVCAIRYRKPSETRDTRYVLAPERVLAHKGGMYLLAWYPERAEFRILGAERIRDVQIREQTFEPRTDREIEAALARPFGIFSGETFALEVRFSPKVAPFVEERVWWGSRERKVPGGDGSLTYHAQVSGELEVEAWVLSFGAEAEVLSPSWLRDRIVDHARRVAARERST